MFADNEEESKKDKKYIQTSINSNSVYIKANNLTLEGSNIKSKLAKIDTNSITLKDLKGEKSYSYLKDSSGVLIREIHTKGYIKENKAAAYIQSNKLIVNNQDITNNLSAKGILNSASKISGVPSFKLKQIEVILAKDKEWDKTTKTLSKMGTLIVNAVSSALTAGAGGFVTSAMSEGAVKVATSAVVDSISQQVTTKVLESLITGEPLKLDLEQIAINSFKAGVSAGVNLEVTNGINNLNLQNTIQADAIDIVTKGTTKTLLYGGSLKDNLIDNATTKLTNKGFKSVGDISMVNNYQEGSAQKILLHALTGGVASKLKGGDFV